MPGFNLSNSIFHRGRDNPSRPNKISYNYTWSFDDFDNPSINTGFKKILLKSCSLPSASFEVESLSTGHTTYQFPKSIIWEDIKATFYDFDGSFLQVMNGDNGGFGTDLKGGNRSIVNQYKDPGNPSVPNIRPIGFHAGTMSINVYYHDWNLAYTWFLQNAWIKSFRSSDMSYEGSSAKTIDMSIAYTYAEATLEAMPSWYRAQVGGSGIATSGLLSSREALATFGLSSNQLDNGNFSGNSTPIFSP